MPSGKLKTYIIRAVRFLIWLFASFLLVFFVILLILQLTAVQTWLTGKIVSRLSEETGAVIDVGRVAIRFPKSVGLKGIYVEEPEGDTLLYAGSIYTDIKIAALLRNRIHINSLEIENLRAFIIRNKPDTLFNFHFLLDALKSNPAEKEESIPEDDKLNPEKADTPLSLRVDRVILNNIRIHFEDHFSGTRLLTSLDYLQTRLSSSDLLNSKYHAGKTVIEGTNIRLFNFEPSLPAKDPDQERPDIDISLASLNITESGFFLENPDGSNINIATSLLNIIPKNIRLHEKFAEISSVRTENLTASIIQPPDHDNSNQKHDQEISAPPDSLKVEFNFSDIMEWTVGIGSLELINSFLDIGKDNVPVSNTVFDPGNFSLGNLNLSAQNIFAGSDSISIDLDDMNMNVSEGFRLSNMDLLMNLGKRSGKVDLSMQTAGSSIGLGLDMEANLLDFKLNDLHDRTMLLELDETSIDKDFAFFLPLMNSYYFNLPDSGPIELSSRITGTPANLKIDSLRITGPDIFNVFLAGDVEGLPEIDSLFLDIKAIELWAVPELVLANLSGTEKPDGLILPEYILAKGQFRGTLGAFETKMDISSDLGDVELLAEMIEERGQESSFKGKLFTWEFDIAKLLQTDLFQQPLSFDLDFKGRGLKPQTMELSAGLTIGQLIMMDYTYNDIELGLTLEDSIATLTSGYKDDFLSIDINTKVGILKEIITAKGNIVIEYADIYQLGMTDKELFIGTEAMADITLYPGDFFKGRINISGTNLAVNGEIYTIPELEIISESKQDDYSLLLNSEFLNASYKGNFTPAGIPQIITDHISEYFTVYDQSGPQDSIGGTEDPESENRDKKYFKLNLHLLPSDAISRVLLPAVENYDSMSVLINYDSQAQKFSLDAVMDELEYSGMKFQNFKTTISSDPGKMDFGVFLQSLNIKETSLYDFDFSGSLFDETLDLSFSFKDDKQQDIFLIGAQIKSIEDLYNIRIDPGNLIINYQNWKIPQDNLIVTGQEYLRFNNFILEHKGSMLSVKSLDENDYDDVTGISVRQLNIRSLTGFADAVIPLRGGILDGELKIRDIYGETGFTANMSIEELLWNSYKIDMITLQANDAGPGQINIKAELEYDGTGLSASGDYFPGEIPAVDIEVVMDNLNLHLIEAFAGDQVTNVSGDITGKLGVKGNIMSPEITGEINFSEAGFRIVELNADYLLKEERIIFDKHNVRLQNFTLEDSQGRTANLDGRVNFENFEDLVFNLNFSTRNFMLMNLPKRRGEMYYGTVLMDSDLLISGSHNNPSVKGRLRLNKSSTFTFVVPQKTPEAIGDEGIVEFISPEEEEFFRRMMERDGTDELRSSFEVMTVNLNIELDKETELTVIIDEMAGDYLDLRGGGVLTFGIDPGGRISLTGRYDITGGEYRLSFHDVASRIFSIREGSNIVFTGDPMEAELDITAVHRVRTNAEQLLRSSVPGGQSTSRSARRQYPFLVYLNMEGELTSPNINFGLDMPPEHRGALDGSLMTRINAINENESELNKQVFALLILGSFIHESPLDAAAGPGISTTARSSASQILSQQLNRLSDRYVKGVDISFDLESYEVDQEDEAVGRTELQVEVSRDFFNERVRVVVGGNIELEDETHRETNPGEIAGDFILEYLLTPEGTLILKGFRKKEYGDLIEGELTRTGVSLVFSRSYNRFRELFRKEEEEQAFKDEQDENEKQQDENEKILDEDKEAPLPEKN